MASGALCRHPGRGVGMNALVESHKVLVLDADALRRRRCVQILAGEGYWPLEAVSREELWWYFHWQHMSVGPLQPAGIEGLPADWLRLKLLFHGQSWLVVCGRPEGMRLVRERALAAGARELDQ